MDRELTGSSNKCSDAELTRSRGAIGPLGVSGRLADRKSPVDLGPHHLAVCCRVVESAEQCTGKVGPGLLQCGDLLVESFQPAGGYGLPFADVSSIQHRGDISQGQPRVLEHAHEDQPPEGHGSISALPGRSSIGHDQAEAFVVPDRRRSDVRTFGDLPDGHERFRHAPT